MPRSRQPTLSPAWPWSSSLREHLDAGDGRLDGVADADDLDFLADLDDAAVDTAGDHGAAAGDREHVFDRHHERQVHRALRLRDVLVDRFHETQDRVVAHFLVLVFQRHQRGTADDRNVLAIELVERQKLAHFHLHQLQQLRIVDHVDLVQEHDERRHADLAGEQDVLARLRHRAVGGGDDEDRAVHLRGAGDHVLHVVGVARAVDVRVVARLRLVFHMGRGDGDAARLLFRRLVDLVVRREARAARLGEHFRDRGGQRGLAVVNMADGADVASAACCART